MSPLDLFDGSPNGNNNNQPINLPSSTTQTRARLQIEFLQINSLFQYFKRRRQNVEIIASLGAGIGLTVFSKLLYELI